MASSGIAVPDAVVDSYNVLKTKKDNRYILYKISNDLKEIEVHKKVEKGKNYSDFMDDLVATGPCYAVYDFNYTTKTGQQSQKLVFISWVPEDTKVKMKMLMSSSKEALKTKLQGLKAIINATDSDEISEETIEQKLRDLDQGGN